jgi:predicted methyltransferase
MTTQREETKQASDDQTKILDAMPEVGPGSAVIQISLKMGADGHPELDIQGILCHAEAFNPYNPAHRFLAAVVERMDELLDAVDKKGLELTQQLAANDGKQAEEASA